MSQAVFSKIALVNIGRHRLRSFFTVSGIAFSVTLFLTFSNLSADFHNQITQIANKYRVDIAVQASDAVTPVSSKIEPEVFQEVSKIPNIEEAILLSVGKIRLPWNPYTLILGMSSMEVVAKHASLLEGSFPQAGQDQVLIGYQTVRQGYRPGERIKLKDNVILEISGTFSSDTPLLNGAIAMSLETSRKLINRDGRISLMMLRIKQGAQPTEVLDQINSQFPELFASPAAALGDHDLNVTLAKRMVVAVFILGLLISFLLITNTLVMSIFERTREFGILFAVGWSRLAVAKLVFLESFALSITGLLLGLGLSWSVLAAVSYLDAENMGWWISPTLEPVTVLISTGLVIAITVLSALYPSVLVARMQTAEALRYE
jgi:putative ABC transport system permease protein